MTIQTDFDTFIGGITTALSSDLVSKLPLVGDELKTTTTTALQFLTDLKNSVDGVLSAIAPGASSQDVITAFNAAHIQGVTAALDPADNTKVAITLSAAPDIPAIALASGALDLGDNPIVQLDAQAGFSATIKPSVNISLSLDPNAGTLSFVDPTDPNAPPEVDLKVGVAVDVSDGHGGPATATLGPSQLGLTVALTDNMPSTSPEISLDFGLDYHSLNPTDFTPVVGGGINLDLGIETKVLGNLLPSIFTDLVVHYDFSNTGASDPTIKFDHVQIGLGSLLEDLLNTLKPVIDIFSAYPFKEIIHTLVDPLPIIGGIPKALPFLHLDPIPEPDGDGVLNFLDLASALDPNDKDTISKFATALPIIEQLISLNESAAGGKKIDLGNIDLTGGVLGFTAASTNPLDQLNAFLGNTPGIVNDVLDAIKDVTNELDPNPLKTDGVAAAGGLTFPLFDDPSKIIDLLVPSLGDGQPVKFIEYTLPELSYTAEMDEFFPIIGPIGISLDGAFSAALELTIGFDSTGFQTGVFTDGFFLSTPLVDPSNPLPAGLAPSPNGHDPVGYVTAAIHAGVGVDLGLAEADFEGGFVGGVEAFFPNGALRFTDIAEGCFFDPFSGKLTADVALKIEIGFGIFSWTHRIVFAEATLADFSADCGGGIGVEDPGSGGQLATINTNPTTDLLLNVGDRADLRHIGGSAGTDVGEVYAIANATQPGGDVFSTPTPLAGVLAINAFGITENYGAPDHLLQTITANFGNGDDSLSVAPDVTQALFIHGNDGDDRLYAGAGPATFYGDAGDDTLVGGAGDDHLYGGDGNDQLEGGAGADWIDGGPGFDQVTYEHSASGVTFTPTTIGGQAAFVGHGGDAEGDTLLNIEYIIGSQYSDVMYGNPNQGNILEGLAGNDVLIGGKGNDFLIGGPGADFMFGDAGEDGTTYVTSWGAVQIDLLSHNAHGGDAEGDVLISIEDVQGSRFDDVLYGDNSRNVLDGWLGDDIIDGRGGPDVISGGQGNDIIYGGADGDILDGGPGIDLLTYEHVAGPVTVNLQDRTGAGGDKMGDIDANNQFVNLADPTGYSSFENLTGSQYSDNLTGDLGYNTIRGLAGNDIINGDGGNDILIGGAGADQLDGGDGIDTASYEDSPGGVYVSLTPIAPLFPGFGLYSDAQGDTLVNIENLRGSLWADTLIGDDNNNVIDPYLSTDGFFAVPGATTSSAGTSIDYVDGKGGYDTLVLDYSQNDFGQGVTGGFDNESGGSGTFLRPDAAGISTLDGVKFDNIEALSVIGTFHDDTVNAGAGNDFVAGGGGDDTIWAGNGSDVILGQEGNDTVYYGTSDFELSVNDGGLNIDGSQAVFFLDGGRGIDTLSISLSAINDDISLVGNDPNSEFSGVNLELPNGSAVVNFEILQDVNTGGGDDYVAQPGSVDNVINTGWGEDVIAPGLGVDTVNGGGDFVFGREVEPFTGSFFGNGPPDGAPVITDRAAFNANAGDLLVLDYSSLTGSGGVVGQVTSHNSQYTVYQSNFNGGFSALPITTNQGSYYGGSIGLGNYTSVSFDEIERLFVTGSDQDDLLVGTNGVPTFSSAYSTGTLRGADVLIGGGGDDLLIGNGGDDVLVGGDGNDILIGADPTKPVQTAFSPDGHFHALGANSNYDQVEVDTLTGGAGADTFVLGTAQGYLYGDYQNYYGSFFGNYGDNHAVITDFTPDDGDVIQLNGDSSHYFTVTQDGPEGHTETLLYSNYGSHSDLIAEIYNSSLQDLNASYIHYVGGPNGDGVEVAAAQRITDEASDSGFHNLAITNFSSIQSFDAPPTSWVTQDNNPNDLLAHLFGGAAPAGFTTVSVSANGDARAFGYFENDPFGIGSGIVLSTGQVDDLPGLNTVDGSAATPHVVSLNFVKIGSFGGSGIFRADLTGLNVNINSLLLQDGNTKIGGSGGDASGFDLDAVTLSHTFVDGDGVDPLATDMNNIGALNVFDFSAAGLVFTAGTQRPADSGGFPNSPDTIGSINGLVDNGFATLGQFDVTTAFNHGWLTFGDGGSLGLNLTQPVSSSGPLYLYVAEAGDNDPALGGTISLSSGRLDLPTDLSTDFGRPGPADDDISFTYKFDVTDANIQQIAFQFALFSEEFPEFAGSDFNDTFKILLNGVNLAHLSDGAAATVDNLMASPHVQLSSDLVLNPAGSSLDTKADAYTKLLTYAGAVNQGENTLTIEVTDVRDGLMDSGILVKAGTFEGGSGSGSGSGNNPLGGAINADAGALSTGTPTEIFEGEAAVLIPVTIDPGFLGILTAPVTIDFSADSQLDFGNGAGAAFSHTFNPGDPLTFDLQVKAPDDHVIEGPRFDAITLDVHSTDSNFDGMAVAPIVVEIDDPRSVLSISDVTKVEGDSGFTAFDFTVTRTGGTGALTVDFATGDGTASSASDYLATNGTLSFAEGDTTKTVEVLVRGDIQNESNENFFVNLTNPNGGVIGDGQGQGTIVNDDGGSGTVDLSGNNANITVSLAATGGLYTSIPTGKVTLTGVINNFSTGAGNDTIIGNNNGDILDGGAGNDTIRGGNGNDVIVGGPGTDRLTGGTGDDMFSFGPNFGHDTITDFTVGDATHHDTLDLRGLGFTSFTDVLNHTDGTASAMVHVGSTGSNDITLQNVTKSALAGHAFDILF